MSLGYIGNAFPDTSVFPSQGLWADCLNTVLNDKGLGYFVAQDFLGNYSVPAATTTAPGIEFAAVGTSVFDNAASATYGANVLSAATGGTDNDHYTLFFEELGSIVRNSGKKLWMEARFAPGALNDSAFFIGFTTRANAVVAAGPIANNPSNSAVAAMTSATFVGFVSVQSSSALATVDAKYEKTTGTPVVVATNVTNSTIFASSGTNGTNFPGGAPASFTAPGNLAANTFIKYGLRFDGNQTMEWYINGLRVASATVDTTFDQSGLMLPAVAVKTGSGAATTNYLDFVRAAFQNSY